MAGFASPQYLQYLASQGVNIPGVTPATVPTGQFGNSGNLSTQNDGLTPDAGGNTNPEDRAAYARNNPQTTNEVHTPGGISQSAIDYNNSQTLRDKQMGMTSQNNSFAFNSETMSGLKKVSDNFQLSLRSTLNQPWTASGTKTDNMTASLASAANGYAQLFNSPQDFQNAYNSSPDVQKSMDAYVKAGGDLNEVATKIQTRIAPYQDNTQTTPDYLGQLTGQMNDGSVAAIATEKALFPESQLAQQEIARQYQMSNDLAKLYFGDENTIGLLKQKQDIAAENKRLIQVKIDNEQTNARAVADLQIQKNNADVQEQQAEIEQNRLNAKNYMTGMLAKLGALQTTGAAPVAIATLDQKYQQQKQQLDTKLSFANQKIQVDLKNDVNTVQSKGDDLIQKIKEDLSKDQETVFKEVLKSQNDTNAEIYKITQGYVKDFKTQKDKYTAEAKSNSDKYISSFMSLAGKGIDVNKISNLIGSDGRIKTDSLTNGMFAKKTTGSSATTYGGLPLDSKNTYTYLMTLPKAFRDWYTQELMAYPPGYAQTLGHVQGEYKRYQENFAPAPGTKTTTGGSTTQTGGFTDASQL